MVPNLCPHRWSGNLKYKPPSPPGKGKLKSCCGNLLSKQYVVVLRGDAAPQDDKNTGNEEEEEDGDNEAV